MKRNFYLALILTFIISIFGSPLIHASSYVFDQNDIIDDSVFNNWGSMSSAQINAFLNGFSGSCISTKAGFSAPDPTGYNPTQGFLYGSNVSAGQVIYDAAHAYGLNPQVLLATLQKEEGLVDGSGPYGCSALAISASVGYGCPDGGTLYNYSGVDLYSTGTTFDSNYNVTGSGTEVTSINGTCVNSSLKVGFSQQIIHATWLLKFGQQRSWGNINWAVISGNWDNSDDPQSCYSGPTMQGTFAVCPSSAATYHDGYYTIDNTVVHINSGATAALYWYTPHFPGNKNFFNIFTQWFGATKSVPLPGCAAATNTSISCVWYLTSSSGAPFLTSSLTLRQELVDNEDYTYHTLSFYGNVICEPGNIPVYLLGAPDGSSFLTTDENERSSLISSGYTDYGIDFYADPSWSNTGTPVYRVHNTSSNQYIWTIDPSLVQSLVQQGWQNQGIAFVTIDTTRQETPPPQGQLNVYRFYIPQSYSHFWTIDINERDNMIKAGYDYEGVAWESSSNTADEPIYRLYAPSLQQHLYTTSLDEKNRLVASGGWNDEGISQYASTTATSKPVYRLYLPSLGIHLWTADQNERNVLVSTEHWNDEGVAWYLP